MQKFFSQRNLPLSDIQEYGLFLRNILIFNIEQGIQQKISELESLHQIAEKIKLQSSSSNESEEIQKMLIQLKELLLKINYSDLKIQIEMALAQTEMTENFSIIKQNINASQSSNLSNSLYFQPVASPNFLDMGISQSLKRQLNTSQNTSMINQQSQMSKIKKCASEVVPATGVSDILNLNPEEKQQEIGIRKINSNIRQKEQLVNESNTSQLNIEQIFTNNSVHSSKNPSKSRSKRNAVFENISQISHDEDYEEEVEEEEEEEEMILCKGGDQEDSISGNEMIKTEYTETNLTSDPKANVKVEKKEAKPFEKPTVQKSKDDYFNEYLKKLIDFENENGFFITPFFKDRDQFMYRFKTKGISIYKQFKQADIDLIWKLHFCFNTQRKVSELLEIPHQIVSRIVREFESKKSKKVSSHH